MQAALVMAALETISSRIKSESASILLFIRGWLRASSPTNFLNNLYFSFNFVLQACDLAQLGDSRAVLALSQG